MALKRPASCLDMKRPASQHDGHGGDSESLATTLELPGLGQEFKITLKGLNVRPPYAHDLVVGDKVIEVRKYSLQSHGMSEVMFIVQTKKEKSDVTKVIGCVEFWSLCTRYESIRDFAWHLNEHCVYDLDGVFGPWDWSKPLYGWHVKTHVEFERPVVVTSELPTRSMLGWLKPVSLTVTLSPEEAEKMKGIMERHGLTQD